MQDIKVLFKPLIDEILNKLLSPYNNIDHIIETSGNPDFLEYYIEFPEYYKYYTNYYEDIVDGLFDYYSDIFDNKIDNFTNNNYEKIVQYIIDYYSNKNIYHKYNDNQEYDLKQIIGNRTSLIEYFEDRNNVDIIVLTIIKEDAYIPVLEEFVNRTYDIAEQYIKTHPDYSPFEDQDVDLFE